MASHLLVAHQAERTLPAREHHAEEHEASEKQAVDPVDADAREHAPVAPPLLVRLLLVLTLLLLQLRGLWLGHVDICGGEIRSHKNRNCVNNMGLFLIMPAELLSAAVCLALLV